jgi:general secretion pathway protein D
MRPPRDYRPATHAGSFTRASISLAVVRISLSIAPISFAAVPIALAVGALALALPATALAAVVSGAGPQPPTPAPATPPPTGGAPGPTLTPKQLRRAVRGTNPLLGSPTGVTPPPAATPGAGAGGIPGPTATGEMAGEKEFNSCKKFPANRRIVKLNMKPDTDLGDLISWISSITCKQFVLPGTIPANSKKVTIIAPQLITPEEAYRLFLSALDSVGLTVAPSGKFLRIIETPRAKTRGDRG